MCAVSAGLAGSEESLWKLLALDMIFGAEPMQEGLRDGTSLAVIGGQDCLSSVVGQPGNTGQAEV